jgi:hypothetical protein
MVNYQYQPVGRGSLDGDFDEGIYKLSPLKNEDYGSYRETLRDLININWTSLIVIVFSITNAAILAWFLCTTQLFTTKNAHLRLADQFYGLSRAISEGAPWLLNRTITTFPTTLQQIDLNDLGRVFPDDPRRYRTQYFGEISPEDRHLLITPSVRKFLAQYNTYKILTNNLTDIYYCPIQGSGLWHGTMFP